VSIAIVLICLLLNDDNVFDVVMDEVQTYDDDLYSLGAC